MEWQGLEMLQMMMTMILALHLQRVSKQSLPSLSFPCHVGLTTGPTMPLIPNISNCAGFKALGLEARGNVSAKSRQQQADADENPENIVSYFGIEVINSQVGWRLSERLSAWRFRSQR